MRPQPSSLPNHPRVKLEGPFDLEAACVLLRAVTPEPGQTWTIDLSGVTRAETAALALLLELRRRALAAGSDIQLVGAPGDLIGLAESFGLCGAAASRGQGGGPPR